MLYFWQMRSFNVRQKNCRRNSSSHRKSVKVIESHGWPGNVRELENRIQRAAIMAENGRVTPEDLGLSSAYAEYEGQALFSARDALDRQMIEAALTRTKGNLTRAASEVGNQPADTLRIDGETRNVSKKGERLMDEFLSIAPDVRLGRNVKLSKFINLYGCSVGDNSKIGAFVEIQKNASVGKNCKVSSHSFICEGVTIEDDVFIGHGVMFINDSFPRATTSGGAMQTEADWKVERTIVSNGASIGSGATILSKVTIGKRALVGAGSVVTRDVPANAVVAGNPARVLRYLDAREGK
jgi:acetyltransferase-like isoleucine patch superfamily enzyme